MLLVTVSLLIDKSIFMYLHFRSSRFLLKLMRVASDGLSMYMYWYWQLTDGPALLTCLALLLHSAGSRCLSDSTCRGKGGKGAQASLGSGNWPVKYPSSRSTHFLAMYRKSHIQVSPHLVKGNF